MFGNENIGERVVAIRNADPETKTVYIFGHGTYDGMVLMPADMEHPMFGLNESQLFEKYKRVYEPHMGDQVPFAIRDDFKADMDKLVEEGEEISEIDKRWLELYEEERANPRYVNDEFIMECVKSARTNPRISLDNGEVVWGAECWWGDPKILDQYTEDGYTVVTVEKEQ